MKATAKEIRKSNLKTLIKQIGTQRVLAETCGLAPAHVSQMVTGNRSMGDEVARRIEDSLNLDYGWMDTDGTLSVDKESVSKEDLLYIKLLGKLPDESKQEIYDLINKEYSKVKARDVFK